MTEEKKKVGRPAKHGKPMTSNERQTARRIRIEHKIKGLISLWDEQICLTILGNKKYAMYQEEAWRRLGQIKGFTLPKEEDE